jgi:hypothetical protein
MPKLTLTHEQQAALKKLRVRAFEQDLRTMTDKQLRAEFRATSSGRVLAIPLVRNAVFQAASWAIEGKAPKISGNLRSLYYQWVKPIVAKLPELLKTNSGTGEDARVFFVCVLDTLVLFRKVLLRDGIL